MLHRHSLDMVNQLQPMSSQIQKGSCCSKCQHVETLHTQPPVIAPQCHQELLSVEALCSPLPWHFQEPKVEAPGMTLPQHYQKPTLSHHQYTLWDDLPAFPMTVADLFQPKKCTKKSPKTVAEQPAHQLRPSQPIVPSPHMQPQYVETPILMAFF